MPTATEQNFVVETIAPADQAGVAEAVRAAHDAQRPLYPLGGCTAQDYGIAPNRPGIGLDLSGLAGIVDYTPRDMTILVEAGARMAELAAVLAAEGQHLPIDVPRSSEATIGGVVATNWSGPRRYGHGTMRDYVIGIHAVDGRGIAFKGGGRVVKNVAGYDFCKLLSGSLGTLGVITQLALKVKPLPEHSATIVGECPDLATADAVLARLAQLEAPPAAIDLLAGAAWELPTSRKLNSENGNQFAAVVIRVDGVESEAEWLAERVQYQLWAGGALVVRQLEVADAESLWSRQVEFSDRGASESADDSPMVLKIAVPPSAVVPTLGELVQLDRRCTVSAHAGNGIIFVRFSQFSHSDISAILIAKLRPAIAKRGGSIVVVSSRLEGLTPHIVWGSRTEAIALKERIKQKFDPRNILNPGRFAY